MLIDLGLSLGEGLGLAPLKVGVIGVATVDGLELLLREVQVGVQSLAGWGKSKEGEL